MKRKPIRPISPRRQAELAVLDAVKRKVFLRDQGRCIICRKPATEFHHIVRRKIGGHVEKNVCCLCTQHHQEAHGLGVKEPDTFNMRRRLLNILEKRHGYDYKEAPWSEYRTDVE